MIPDADPLRVLFLDPVLTSPGYDLPLVRAIRDAGVDLDIGTSLPIRPTAFAEPQFEFFRIVHRHKGFLIGHVLLRRVVRVLEYPQDLSRLVAFVRKGGHRVVHFNWLAIPSLDVRFMRRVQKMGIGVVLTAHDVKPHEAGKMPASVLAAYRQADRMITLTEYVKQGVSAPGVCPEKIRVIPHGDLGEYMPTEGTPAGPQLPPDFRGRPLVVCLGNIRPYKGVPDLLRSWPLVLAKMPEARLVIAGQLFDVAKREVMSALSAMGDQSDTVYREFGFLSSERYQGYLSDATVLVQPYRWASQSGNTVQAYRSGTPVVCTRAGGLPEMILEGTTGSVARTGDSESLAEALVRILRCNAHGEMGAACRELAETRFSWGEISLATIEVYREAAELRNRL